MIFAAHHRFQRLAICKGQHTDFRTGKELFHNDFVAGSTEYFILHNGLDSTFRFFQILCNDNTLAKGKTIRLDNNRKTALFLNIGKRVLWIIKHTIICSRNMVFFHQIFAKDFAGLNLCRRTVRAECRNSRCLQSIHHTCCKRIIRRHTNKAYSIFFRKIDDFCSVHGLNGYIFRITANATVSGGTVNFVHSAAFH